MEEEEDNGIDRGSSEEDTETCDELVLESEVKGLDSGRSDFSFMREINMLRAFNLVDSVIGCFNGGIQERAWFLKMRLN
jgi:hypothetical protein